MATFPQEIKALITSVDEKTGAYVQTVQRKPVAFLPQHEVWVEVHYSSLNYKDALSAFGKNKVTKHYPHITGIDVAGVVIEDKTNTFHAGDEVLVMGYDLGMNTFGGHASHVAVPAAWVCKKPQGLSFYECMCLGTSGFTAGLAWQKMQPYLSEIKQGDFLITGASGGVGSTAIALFAHEGVQVVAASTKPSLRQRLLDLGAKDVISTAEILGDGTPKPLRKPLWTGALDNLGGAYLSAILSAIHKEGCVLSVGLVASAELQTTVLPFILNGVNLLGINAADTLMSLRMKVWEQLTQRADMLRTHFFHLVETVDLEELPTRMKQMIENKSDAKVVVKIH